MPSNNRNRRNSVDSIASAHEHDSDYVPSDSEWDDDRAWEEANLVEEPAEKQPVTRQRTALAAAKTTTSATNANKRASATSNTARKSARIQAARK
jgi:hypothetical protein